METARIVWNSYNEKTKRGDYGRLPAEAMDKWALHQIALSEGFKKDPCKGISATEEGRIRKRKMLSRIEDALTKRSNFSANTIAYRLTESELRLEDPGLLENFEYFDIPSSDFMLQFYFAVWDNRIAEVMDYLHNYGKDLKGIFRKIPSNDIWYQMSYFEGMNIDKRKQAQCIVDFMKSHKIAKATSFGGGHVPERFYGLPSDLRLTVFDNGKVCPIRELFADANERSRVEYFHEPLSDAPSHRRLLGTQQLVWMNGVSMYLDESQHQMTGAILCAAALLQSGGYMKYDYLIWNQSMRRVISTQCWPYDPRHPMTIFDGPTDAIEQGRHTLETVNFKLANKATMDLTDVNVNVIEPWGVTSVCFTIKKHT